MVDNSNPFYVDPGNDLSQGLQGLRGTVAKIGERHRQEEALTIQRTEIQAAMESKDPDKIRSVMAKYPEVAKGLKAAIETKFPGESGSKMKDAYFKANLDFNEAPGLVSALREQYAVDGLDQREIAELDRWDKMIVEDPEAAKKEILSGFAILAEKEDWDRYQDIKGGGDTKRTQSTVDLQLEDDLSKQYVDAGMSKTEGRLAARKEISGNIGKGPDKGFAPDPLTKLYNQIDKLPEDSPRRVAYQRAIDKLTTDSNPELEMVIAQRIVDGKLDFNTLSRRGGQKGRIAAIIAEIAPEFNLIDAAANIRYKTAAGNLQSIALIAGIQPLFDELKGQAKALNNGLIPIFNKGINFYKRQTGEAKIVAFDNLRDDVIAEVERVLMGSGVLSDSKYNRALHNLNSAQSPEQMGAAIEQMMLVVEKREEALRSEPYPQGEGQQVKTIYNPVTKERLYLRNGKWEAE